MNEIYLNVRLKINKIFIYAISEKNLTKSIDKYYLFNNS